MFLKWVFTSSGFSPAGASRFCSGNIHISAMVKPNLLICSHSKKKTGKERTSCIYIRHFQAAPISLNPSSNANKKQ
ncbi:hypothetical protein Hanom_Chr03g00233051 [Helianthus anomalus]